MCFCVFLKSNKIFENVPYMRKFVLLFCSLTAFFINAQHVDSILLKQSSLMRMPLTVKDFGLKGKVKMIETTTSNLEGPPMTTVRRNYFSETSMLLKTEFSNMDIADDKTVWNYHYSNNKLDSITMNDGTGKQIFHYDQKNRLISQSNYGKYDDTKDQIEETESYFYNDQDMMIKKINDSTKFVILVLYDAKNQLKRSNFYHLDTPEDVNVSEYDAESKIENTIMKRNGKIIYSAAVIINSNGDFDVVDTKDQDNKQFKFTYEYIYDKNNNYINQLSFLNGKKDRVEDRKIVYYSDGK